MTADNISLGRVSSRKVQFKQQANGDAYANERCCLIKELPTAERPREKLIHLGARALSDAELVAILLRTGTAKRSALALAADLTAEDGLYKRLAAIDKISELLPYKGLGEAKAASVVAALELGRRLATARALERQSITCPQDAYDYLSPRLRYATREIFVVVILNAKNRVIGSETVSEGALSTAVVQAREVFRSAILQNAAAIIVAHNHPSGDPTPSKEDRDLTSALKKAGSFLGIALLDHIIIGDASYYSFEQREFRR